MNLDLADATHFVRSLVEAQGALVIDRWRSAVPAQAKDRRDFATSVDVEVEQHLKAALADRFPGHGLSGEETGADQADAEYQWLIDPIDGTKYYAAQASLFSLSVGLLYRDRPVLGVVYDAAANRCFHAFDGGGAFVDDERLTGSAVVEMSRVIINVDTPQTHALSAAERAWFEGRLLELTRRVYRIRALGLGSLAACWLASGAFDAYVDLTGYTKPQDLAAGRVIMREAGARVEALEPSVGPPRLLAAPPALWEPLRDLLTGGIQLPTTIRG